MTDPEPLDALLTRLDGLYAALEESKAFKYRSFDMERFHESVTRAYPRLRDELLRLQEENRQLTMSKR